MLFKCTCMPKKIASLTTIPVLGFGHLVLPLQSLHHICAHTRLSLNTTVVVSKLFYLANYDKAIIQYGSKDHGGVGFSAQ